MFVLATTWLKIANKLYKRCQAKCKYLCSHLRWSSGSVEALRFFYFWFFSWWFGGQAGNWAICQRTHNCGTFAFNGLRWSRGSVYLWIHGPTKGSWDHGRLISEAAFANRRSHRDCPTFLHIGIHIPYSTCSYLYIRLPKLSSSFPRFAAVIFFGQVLDRLA